MKNYLLANFRLHHFKSLGYRKLANICKSMHIRKPFVQKNKKNCFLYKCLGKIISLEVVFFYFKFLLLFDPAYCTVYTVQVSNPRRSSEYCRAKLIYPFFQWQQHCNILVIGLRFLYKLMDPYTNFEGSSNLSR